MTSRIHRSVQCWLHRCIVLAVVIGVAGLAPALAAASRCAPDCPMHQEQAAAPPCCMEDDGGHAATAEGAAAGQRPTAPCCATALCLDPAVPGTEMAAACGSPAASVVSTMQPSGLEPPPPAPQSRPVPRNLLVVHSNTPIYIRTCVFLI